MADITAAIYGIYLVPCLCKVYTHNITQIIFNLNFHSISVQIFESLDVSHNNWFSYVFQSISFNTIFIRDSVDYY